MVSNCEYFRTPSGIIKSISIITIAVVLALSLTATIGSGYVKNRGKFRPEFQKEEVNLWREFYFIASAGVCLIISVANLLVHGFSRDIYWNRKTGIYDFFYHAISFVLLSTSAMLNIVSAVTIFDINCTNENECQLFELKIAAGGIGLIGALLYAFIAVLVLTNRKDVERDGLLNEDK